MSRRNFLLTLIGLLLAGPGLAPASSAVAMIVVSPDPPSMADVLVGRDAAGDVGSYLCSHGSGTVVDLGQTFRLSRPATLDRITLKVRPRTDRTTGELVTLVLGTYTDPGDDSMNELLAAETCVLPTAIPTGEVRYVTFDVTNFPLEADRQYGLSLGFTGGGNVNDARLDVLHAGGDVYPDGLAMEKAGAITSALPNDLVLFLHGVPQVVDQALSLHGGRFRVEAAWRTFAGDEGPGYRWP